MKTDKNILIAFILNISFSIFELIGGVFTRSIAIISDAIHDFGDSISIGVSYFLEKKSKNKADSKYTYGYARYSVLGALITNMVLVAGSSLVIYNAIMRILNPVDINYNGMIVFAIIGTIINFIAAYVTREGESLNQKAVNLHMLEDVLGWVIVLIGAIIMKFTNLSIIDPIMSIGVALFIVMSASKNFETIISLFLEKTPNDIDLEEIKKHILELNGVIGIHHVHVWSIDGFTNFATMHVVTNSKNKNIKEDIRKELKEHNIEHVTLELEEENENCKEKECISKNKKIKKHHHLM